jgi:epoxyqueuosine reductase
MQQSLKEQVIAEARAAGFDVARIASASAIGGIAGHRLEDFLRQGRHGDMQWMATTAERRRDPRALWPQARSIVMVGMSYAPDHDPLDALAHRDCAAISCYAQRKDYHDVIKSGLKQVAARLAQISGGEVKVFVDTAPLMEKPLGEAAGLGWQGKHTNLVSREFGSWLLLGAILTTSELEPDVAEIDHCGSCSRCLDVCPTQAFPAPYQLDARRCIAYLTIEHRGHIPTEFRRAIGNRVFGCDDCLAVCPWNKFAAGARQARLAAMPGHHAPPLAELLALDDASFRRRFAGTPVKRTGRDRVIRNALIAAGNSGEAHLIPAIERLLDDASPLVRAMAVWALKCLADPSAWLAARHRREGCEPDGAVRAEWAAEMA